MRFAEATNQIADAAAQTASLLIQAKLASKAVVSISNSCWGELRLGSIAAKTQTRAAQQAILLNWTKVRIRLAGHHLHFDHSPDAPVRLLQGSCLATIERSLYDKWESIDSTLGLAQTDRKILPELRHHLQTLLCANRCQKNIVVMQELGAPVPHGNLHPMLATTRQAAHKR
ncbi:MAG TPA: hypothetical protein PK280_02685 [Planctomycetota bacterium]|nr:hypothetical protein [Planctomycetota bacterium]